MTKVSADVLPTPAKAKTLSPREQNRLAMEARLEKVIKDAAGENGSNHAAGPRSHHIVVDGGRSRGGELIPDRT